MLIVIGSLRPAKVDGVREAIAAIARLDDRFKDSHIQTVDVGDVAPRMPMTQAAVVDGARARAAAAFVTAGTVAFAVGVEGGMAPLPVAPAAGEEPRYSLQTWACVTNGTLWSYGAGGSLMLPDAITARVLGGEELGDIVDSLAAQQIRGTRGAWGLLTRDLVTRRDAFRTAVLAAFTPFFNASLY